MVVCSSYSYSDIITGVTPNAASTGLNWTMANVLPQEAGLEVNAVLYRYTTMKDTQDDMYVTLRNQNAISSGYLFSQTDNWSQLPGNTITKAVPVNNIPIQYWGDGEINVQGRGTVTNAQVVYSYRYDTCYNPITDPTCPGYEDAMAKYLKDMGLLEQKPIEVIDPLQDESVQNAMNNKTETREPTDDEKAKKEKEEKDKKKKLDDKERRMIALRVAESTINNALAVSQSEMVNAMNVVPQFESYYTSMSGGVYADANGYKLVTVPESRQGLRNGLAQQILHDKMVDAQYNK